MYLQGHDGVPVSAETIAKLSNKVRSVWDFLNTKDMAPTTFSKMSWAVWDLFARAMLTDPRFDFLLLYVTTRNGSCENGPLRVTQAGLVTGESDRRTLARRRVRMKKTPWMTQHCSG